MGSDTWWDHYHEESDLDYAYEHGKRSSRDTLARILTEARKGKDGAGDYLKALDDVAVAMGLKRTEKVEYVA